MDVNTTTYLPHDIIESILSRLPVKSLLRFKSVCKQWNATISDPKFAQTHLQISKNSSSLSLSCLLVHEERSPLRAHLVTFENDAFLQLSAVDYPKPRSRLLCHCDGLYLISNQDGRCREYEYALWNPSRRSCKKLNQYTFDRHELIRGICYDPLLDDYKVVMADAKHYAVFHCRKNQWSDLKEMNPNFKITPFHASGASLKGSIYWVSLAGEECESIYEIVYFDGRDAEWKNLGEVGIDERALNVQLISCEEGLYVFQIYGLGESEPWFNFMKKVGDGDGDGWVVLRGPDYCGGFLRPVLCSHENKIILCENDDYAAIYNVSQNSLAIVLECPFDTLSSRSLFPYQENMFWD